MKLKIANSILAIKLKALPCESAWYWKHIYFIKEKNFFLDCQSSTNNTFQWITFSQQSLAKLENLAQKLQLLVVNYCSVHNWRLQIRCLKRHTTEATIKHNTKVSPRKERFNSYHLQKASAKATSQSQTYLFSSLVCMSTYLLLLKIISVSFVPRKQKTWRGKCLLSI